MGEVLGGLNHPGAAHREGGRAKMLVLTRRPGERIVIAGNITVEVIDVCHGQVRLGVTAPRDVPVFRDDFHGRRDAAPRDTRAAD
jgi:carbon storage regulator